MKKILLFILSLIALSGCNSKNEDAAMKWVNDHKKPIRCTFIKQDYIFGDYEWFLLDPSGNYYYTGSVGMKFPDTIKAHRDTVIIHKVIIDIKTHAYPNRGWVKCGSETWYSMDTTEINFDTQKN